MTLFATKCLAGPIFAGLLLLSVASPSFAAPLAPDTDGDGVPDAQDLCPDTPPRATPVLRGCAAIEAAPRIDDFVELSWRAYLDASDAVSGVDDLASFGKRLQRAGTTRRAALAQIRAGDPCKAQVTADKFLAKLGKLDQQMQRKVTSIGERSARSLVEVPDNDSADVTPAELHMADLLTAEALFERSLGELSTDLRSLAPLCSTITGPLRKTARVVRVDDSKRLLELDDGMLVMMGTGEQKHHFSKGNDVAITGSDWGNNTGVATGVAPVAAASKPAAMSLECLALRIVPIQPLPPAAVGPFTLHDPEAYRAQVISDNDPNTSELLLEHGMRLAVVDTGGCIPPGPSADGSTTRLSAQIDVEIYGYGPKVTLSSDLADSDDPVLLPQGRGYGNLTMTVRKQTCFPTLVGMPPNCGPFDEVRTEERALYIEDNGTLCNANYASTEFSVEDVPAPAFGVAQVVNPTVEYILPAGPLGGETSGLTFSAEGYSVSGGVSSYPMVMSIGENQDFAIHTEDKDFYDPEGLFQFESSGVTNPSGLRWPRMTGMRHGHPFWYSCNVPVIARDMLATCPTLPNTYYRFPFEGGAPTWTMGQGNNGAFTHKGNSAFAFDFGAPANTPVIATRRGTVLSITSSNTGNCFCAAPTCQPATCVNCSAPNGNNFMAIRHQDGTIGRYFHFPQGGPVVAVGDKVARGDLLTVVGSIGCSSNPHMHFESLLGLGLATKRITFESAVVGNETCYIPNTGNPIESTNVQN